MRFFLEISTCADSQLPTHTEGMRRKEWPLLPVNYKMHETKKKKKSHGHFRAVGLFIFTEIEILPIQYILQ